MIAQFKTLQTVKALREDKALRLLEAARTALHKAQTKAEALRVEVAESKAQLPARERAIYAKILKAVVDIAAVDRAKDQVLNLLEDHQKLSDRHDRAVEFVRHCEGKLAEARAELAKRQAEVEKITTLTEGMIAAAAAAALAAEESEIEDLFARPVALPDVGGLS